MSWDNYRLGENDSYDAPSASSTPSLPAYSRPSASASTPTSAPPTPTSITAQLHPSLLETVTHTHQWAFGAVAELIDNAYDAGATHISLDYHEFATETKSGAATTTTSAASEKFRRALVVADDGCGLSHAELLRMLQFGHAPNRDTQPNRIGRSGMGFKQGM
jgi:hypothetical protein